MSYKQERRRERRKEKREAWLKANPLLAGVNSSRGKAPLKACDKALEARPAYEPVPIKFIVQDAFWQLEEYKRNIERAAIVYANEFGRKQDVSGAVCLPEVALFAAGHRTSKQVTAR